MNSKTVAVTTSRHSSTRKRLRSFVKGSAESRIRLSIVDHCTYLESHSAAPDVPRCSRILLPA